MKLESKLKAIRWHDGRHRREVKAAISQGMHFPESMETEKKGHVNSQGA